MNKSLSNSIIYNVYPTSFYDSNGDGIGDLRGITEKLPYIKQFADIVWINPVYKSPFRDGGYDIEDYYEIDPKFGNLEDVKNLTEKAHSLGLKVLFDLVVGHTSDRHPWFLESQKHDKNEYSDYYIWNDDVFGYCPYKNVTGTAERNGNFLVNFFSFQPSLNFGFAKKTLPWQKLYTDPACEVIHEEVIRIIKFYLELGVDGFRVDLANSIVKDDEDGKYSCLVWKKIFGKVREEYPETIFVSEWGQPRFAVKNGDYDIDFLTHCFDDGYNMLFRKEKGTNVFMSEGNSFFRKAGKGDAKPFFSYFLSNLKEISENGYISVVTGNHDLPRISIGRTPDELKTVFAFILALPNVPLIYYGDEIGMAYSNLKNKDGGYIRTGSRTPMQWSADKNAGFSTTDSETYLPIPESYKTENVEAEEKNPDSLLNTVKKLVKIKRENPDLFSATNDFALISDLYPLFFKRTGENG
ncbi:MAG: glycosylase, partial [Clostridia bacterium]|nr:glycosylase [Clostridia bacterium]